MAEGIVYPEDGINGKNILRSGGVEIQSRPVIYSMRVDIPKGSRVRVIIPVPDDPENTWSYFKYAGMSVGWKHTEIENESGREAHFLADIQGYADLPAYFTGHNSVDIKIFENADEDPSRIKTITW
ncbi:MAG: hypothetical protein JW864_16630 [Spirochaetes bacterium]|nr:hypothetical protein [Spirochaetota bacterium]